MWSKDEPFVLENLQEQRDEVLALQSIYNTDDDEKLKLISEVSEDDEGVFSMVVFVCVKPVSDRINVSVAMPNEDEEDPPGAVAMPEKPKNVSALPQSVKLNRSISGCKWEGSFQLKYLSPLMMYITFPSSYPSHNPPSYHLSCEWLTSIQAQSLSTALNGLWQDASSMPIVFTWIDWLENNTLEYLGITDHLTISVHQYEEDSKIEGEESMEGMIPRVEEIGNIVAYLIQYNRELEDVEFCQNQHVCEVCCDEKPGTQFFKLHECGHIFCHECMMGFCELHVRDGTVEELRCPDTECNTLMPPYVIQAVLDPVAYDRWEKLLLQKTLDAMGDTVYCPRCQSLVIAEEEEQSHLAHCTVCYFSFCTECKMCWHQGSACVSDEDRLEQVIQRRTALSAEERKKYDEIVRKLEEEVKSKRQVIKNTRNCPKCKIPVEKIGGCNKMTCKCGSSFCWICGIAINGYCHFRENSKCILFPGQANPDQPNWQRALPPDAIIRIRARIAVNPALQDNQARCPMCKQNNLKSNNNNHIKCWNCKGNFCFLCGNRIVGNVTVHFRGPCIQHS